MKSTIGSSNWRLTFLASPVSALGELQNKGEESELATYRPRYNEQGSLPPLPLTMN